MTPKELRDWLRQIGQDREWLAKQCRVSKRTVDGWFTKGIPPIACALIEKLAEEHTPISFTFEEWQKINKTMYLLGYNDFKQFLLDSIKVRSELGNKFKQY